MKLIDKDALVAEIERLRKEDGNPYSPSETTDMYYARGVHLTCDGLVNFLNTLEVKEVDLEKEYEEYVVDDPIFGNFITNDTMGMELAKHFFELGLKANQEDNVIGTLEREVKIDAGGYPCIDCYIEFYDYDKDIPLAKEGDKVKVIIMKGE